jgi:hypothetical protein
VETRKAHFGKGLAYPKVKALKPFTMYTPAFLEPIGANSVLLSVKGLGNGLYLVLQISPSLEPLGEEGEKGELSEGAEGIQKGSPTITLTIIIALAFSMLFPSFPMPMASLLVGMEI